MLLPVVTLKTPRNSRHPWIFKKMISAPRIPLEPGSLVEVRDKAGKFVARAFFHPDNTIAIRILTENPKEDIDESFLQRRLAVAKQLRETVLDLSVVGDSYRLVHAEADNLPGLVIDVFRDIVLVEPYVAGWLHLADELAGALRNLYPDCRVVFRSDKNAEKKEGVSFARVEKRYPAPEAVTITENGIRYRVDFQSGHKTGFFLDQRDNRRRVAALAAGRDVLDLCCYSGGFSLSARHGGARRVTAVDLDEDAITMARNNARLNDVDDIRFVHADMFQFVRDEAEAGRFRQLVVLDPPKLAGGQDDVERALRTYYDMNRAAMAVVEAGGLFVTCSCSGAVPEERWRQAVRKAGADAGRGLVIFESTGPGADHPVAGDFPQGRYLKAMFMRVD